MLLRLELAKLIGLVLLLNGQDHSPKYLQEVLEQIKIRTKKEIASIIIGMILQLTSYRTMFLSLALTSCISLCYSQCVLSKRSVVKNATLRIPL